MLPDPFSPTPETGGQQPGSSGAPYSQRPVYPGADYYQELARQREQQPQPVIPHDILPQSPYQPSKYDAYASPTPIQVPIRTHNRWTRFLVSWGGGQRLAISLGTMALSVVVYYYFWQSWFLALGITVLILIHEMGHALTLRFKKLPATFPIFIPGIGAFVTLPNRPMSMRDHIDVSLAGPFAGGLGSLACLLVAFVAPDPFLWRVLAMLGFFLNLLNLLPVLPLDGGHVAVLLSRWLVYAGFGLLILGFYYTHSFFIIYLAIFGLPMTLQSLRAAQYGMRPTDQFNAWAMYLVLCLGLFAGLFFTQMIPLLIQMYG